MAGINISSPSGGGFFSWMRRRFEPAAGEAPHRRDEASDIILFGPQTSNRGAFSWVPFTTDFDLQRIRSKYKEALELRRRGDLSKVKDRCEWNISRLEKLDDALRHEKESKEASDLLGASHLLLGDVYLTQGEWETAEFHYNESVKAYPPRSPKISRLIGDRYLQLGHLLWRKRQEFESSKDLEKSEKLKTESIRLFEKSGSFKPSLDNVSNDILVKNWISLGRTDGKAMQKYLQCIKPDDWLNLKNRTLINDGCKINPTDTFDSKEVLGRIRLNQRIIIFHPDWELSHRNLGHGFLKLGEYEKALKHFEKAREIMFQNNRITSGDVSLWIGKAAYLAGDFRKSALEYAAITTVPDNHKLFCGLAMAHVFFDQPLGETSTQPFLKISREDIEKHLAAAETHGHLNAEAYFFLGLLSTLRGHHNEALDYLRSAVGAAPDIPLYLIHFAELLKEQGVPSDLETAKKLLKKAHILLDNQNKETDAEVMYTLGELFEKEGNKHEARRWFDKASAVCPDNSRVLLMSAWNHLKAEEYSEAYDKAGRIGSLKERIQREKCFILGRCSMRMNRPIAEARDLLEKAIGLGMEGWEPYYWLGICFAHERDFDSGKRYLLKALQKDCNEKARVLVQMGNVLFLQGVMNEAVRCFDKAQKLALRESDLQTRNRLHHDALFGLAKAHAAKGNHEEARELFEKLLGLDSHDEAANYSIALLYEQVGDLAKCKDHLRRVIENFEAGSAEKSAIAAKACARLGVLLSRKAAKGHAHLDDALNRALCEEAENLLHRASKLGIQDDTHIFYMGLLEILTGRIEQGRRRWVSLKENGKMEDELELNLKKVNYLQGVQHFDKGEFEPAIRAFEDGVGENLTEWKAEVFFRWGMEFMRKKAWGRAIELMDKAIHICPMLDMYHVGKGACLMLSGNGAAESATDCFSKALEINPQSTHGLFALGLFMYLQGDGNRADAIEVFKSLNDLPDANEMVADVSRMLILFEELRSGRNEVVEELIGTLKQKNVLEKLQFLGNDFNTLLAHGLVMHHDGTATSVIDGLSQKAPSGALDYALALIHSLIGNPEYALEHFERVYHANKSDRTIAEQYAGMLCYSATVSIGEDLLEKSLEKLEKARQILTTVGLP